MSVDTAAPDHIGYLDAAAAVPLAQDYKQRTVAALHIRPGDTVLDVGCGPGTDLARLADAAGPDGTVIGIDADPAMVEEATRRFSGKPAVRIQPGDAHALPLPDASVDRARIDRVLQHLTDPSRALAELHRVLRTGGRLAMAEPDWDTLAVDDPDTDTCRAYARYVRDNVRNGVVGRQLARRATEVGFTVERVDATVLLFRDFTSAERVLGLRRVAARAVRDGVLAQAAARAWLDRLATGPCLAGFTFYTVVAVR